MVAKVSRGPRRTRPSGASWTTIATATVATTLTAAAIEVGPGPAEMPSAQVIGAAAPIAPSWPRVPLQRRHERDPPPVNQLATSRSRQIQVIASPMPTKHARDQRRAVRVREGEPRLRHRQHDRSGEHHAPGP
jgi:hypothetical protein